MKKLGFALVLAVMGTTTAAEETLSIAVQRLTLDAAMKVAEATLEACRAKGAQASVTVVDRDGQVQVSLRDTVAPPVTLPISEGKAKAAANFSVASAELSDRGSGPLGRVEDLVMAQGALVIEAAGTKYGAVGVSGAPSGLMDEDCARAGLDAIRTDLEMAP